MASSTDKLLDESRELVARARETLSAMPAAQSERIQTTTTRQQENKAMSDVNSTQPELTPQVAAQLYSDGKTVIEVARQYGTSYSKVRKLISTAGV